MSTDYAAGFMREHVDVVVFRWLSVRLVQGMWCCMGQVAGRGDRGQALGELGAGHLVMQPQCVLHECPQAQYTCRPEGMGGSPTQWHVV
jgi:hypothetical protein